MWNLTIKAEEGKSLKCGMVFPFVYVILMNVFETWHKSKWRGRVDLNSLYRGIRESLLGRLTDKKWILSWVGERDFKKGFISGWQCTTVLFHNYADFKRMAIVFLQWCLRATYGTPFLICSWLLAPQLPGINMLKGRQLNFPLWLLR